MKVWRHLLWTIKISVVYTSYICRYTKNKQYFRGFLQSKHHCLVLYLGTSPFFFEFLFPCCRRRIELRYSQQVLSSLLRPPAFIVTFSYEEHFSENLRGCLNDFRAEVLTVCQTEASQILPTGQMLPPVWFCKQSLVGTQPCPLAYCPWLLSCYEGRDVQSHTEQDVCKRQNVCLALYRKCFPTHVLQHPLNSFDTLNIT